MFFGEARNYRVDVLEVCGSVVPSDSCKDLIAEVQVIRQVWSSTLLSGSMATRHFAHICDLWQSLISQLPWFIIERWSCCFISIHGTVRVQCRSNATCRGRYILLLCKSWFALKCMLVTLSLKQASCLLYRLSGNSGQMVADIWKCQESLSVQKFGS